MYGPFHPYVILPPPEVKNVLHIIMVCRTVVDDILRSTPEVKNVLHIIMVCRTVVDDILRSIITSSLFEKIETLGLLIKTLWTPWVYSLISRILCRKY